MDFNLIKWTDTFVQDFDKGQQFYSQLFGWQYADQYEGDQLVYSLARLNGSDESVDGAIVAGIAPHRQVDPQGIPWNWGVYILVEELETSIDKVVAAGGQLCKEPMEVMGTGRMAVCFDAGGAVIHLWQALTEFGAQVVGVPGAVGWYELTCEDAQESVQFYEKVFGWNAVQIQRDGESFWQLKSGQKMVGGMHTRINETRNQGLWIPYFITDKLAQQLDGCKKLGGGVVFGPVTVGATGQYAILQDFEGNLFGLAQYKTN